jgi:hypothetical protein
MAWRWIQASSSPFSGHDCGNAVGGGVGRAARRPLLLLSLLKSKGGVVEGRTKMEQEVLRISDIFASMTHRNTVSLVAPLPHSEKGAAFNTSPTGVNGAHRNCHGTP